MCKTGNKETQLVFSNSHKTLIRSVQLFRKPFVISNNNKFGEHRTEAKTAIRSVVKSK